MKVSSVLCTYGRHACVQRSTGMFLGQDYQGETELIIFNTSPVPLELGEGLAGLDNIINVHAPTNPEGNPWSSLGEVRNAALDHATGDLYACWDDDDLFLPFHLTQGVRHWLAAKAVAWKPEFSLFSTDGGVTFRLAGNAMEASILARLDFVKEHRFSTKQSGGEHVQGGWLDICRIKRGLVIENVKPSYAYVWGDGLHKTSGSIDNPDNFENHQAASQDFGEGKPLVPATPQELEARFQAAYDFR